MTDSPIVQALLARSMPPGGVGAMPQSDDAMMWRLLTGGAPPGRSMAQHTPQIGSPALQIATGPQTMELARAGLASAGKGQLFGMSR